MTWVPSMIESFATLHLLFYKLVESFSWRMITSWPFKNKQWPFGRDKSLLFFNKILIGSIIKYTLDKICWALGNPKTGQNTFFKHFCIIFPLFGAKKEIWWKKNKNSWIWVLSNWEITPKTWLIQKNNQRTWRHFWLKASMDRTCCKML